MNNETRGQNSTKNKSENTQRKTQVLGYVPIQVTNLSLEEICLAKQTNVGVASPIQIGETQELEGYNVNSAQRESTAKQGDFDKCSWREISAFKRGRP